MVLRRSLHVFTMTIFMSFHILPGMEGSHPKCFLVALGNPYFKGYLGWLPGYPLISPPKLGFLIIIPGFVLVDRFLYILILFETRSNRIPSQKLSISIFSFHISIFCLNISVRGRCPWFTGYIHKPNSHSLRPEARFFS